MGTRQGLSVVVFAFSLTIFLSSGVPAYQEDSIDMKALVDGNTAFATDLYAQLKTQQGNIFFSPYSISTALAMTYAGARGTTAEQMSRVLHLPWERTQLHKAFGRLVTELNTVQEKGHIQLSIANATWAQKEYHFLDEFVDVVRGYYQAEVSYADFKAAYEAARNEINAWVEGQTNNKITELLKRGVLDALTRLILVNAIYFKGMWATQFKETATKNAAFWVTTDTTVDVPMMSQECESNYAENDRMQILELLYAGDDVSMVILLPKRIDGLARLEASLSTENLDAWLDPLKKQKVLVYIPRFNIRCQFSLEKVLASMGMPDAFDPDNADFSGIDGSKMLSISAVVHEAFVDVNEEGTEAAAATGVVIGLKSVPLAPPVFRADHPFMFVIRDKQSGSILFLGRVINPTQ